ncbi:MAG: SufE family protein [Planctomycetes bacterium]|nr:SufE family protein [Planctomycetota bacterium]
MSIVERQQKIVDEFGAIADWEERYKRIIEYGRKMPAMDPAHQVDKNKVKGCQSTVWLHGDLKDGKVIFAGDSDAMIVRGLVALALSVYSDATPAEILNTPPTFLEKTGLMSHLSQTRANGLAAVIKQIKFYALAFDTLLKRKA